MAEFNHYTPIQIRFADLDALNHVNNANYMTYMETARMAYCEDVLSDDLDWTTVGMILAQATVDFKKPILLKDELQVGTRCSRLGNKSFDLSYTVIRNKGADWEEAATGHTVLVAYNYTDDETMRIPARWKEKLIDYEGGAV